MSGLNPETDLILEIATLVTDNTLKVIAEGPELVIHQDEALFDKMDSWNKKQHAQSGLWKAVLESKITLAEAEKQSLDFIKAHCGKKESPLCGNSIWQDRRFLYKYMAELDEYLHYRILDVSTIKELVQRLYPDSCQYKGKENAHRALDDIRESIDELKFYMDRIFKKPEDLG